MLKTGLEYVDITPYGNVPLIGYGDRTHNSTGVHDPLFAYVWYIESNFHMPLVWIVTDLCLFNVNSIRTITEKISEKTGFRKECIFIQTTHTHSGPDTYDIAGDSSPWAEKYLKLLINRISEGIKTAVSNSFYSRIEVREGNCSLAGNRRKKGGPVDTRVILLTLIDKDGRERGLLFHYSCHLTILGVENYLISSDWAGPARNLLQEKSGVPVCFLQGAEGNIDPVFRGLLDMADPDQAKGSPFPVVEQAGIMMAEAVLAARESMPIRVLDNLSYKTIRMELPLRYGALTENQVEEKLMKWKKQFADFLEIPVEEVTEDLEINALIKDRCRKIKYSQEETRQLVAEQFAYIQFIWAYKLSSEFIDQQKGTLSCDITEISFDALTLLGIPAEVLVETALEYQARKPEKTVLIAGLFNGSFGYMPHVSNFRETDSDSLYETISTIFGEGTSEIILNKF